MNSATTITTTTGTGAVTTRTVSVRRMGSEVLVVKEFATKDANGFTDFNSVIVCQGSAKRAKAYLVENGFALDIPAKA